MRASSIKDYQERINRVCIFIQEHLAEPMRLADLAACACFSPFHFHRIFLAHTGETLNAHIRRLRLERAAQHLLHSSNAITDIALDAGYETPSAFNKAFAQHFNCTPSHFRKAENNHLLLQQRMVIVQTRKEIKPMKPELKTTEPTQVLYVRKTGKYSDSAMQAWQALCAFAGPKGLLGPGVDCIGISHDDPCITPEDKLRYDACITMKAEVQPEGEAGVQTIPGGRYAIFMHKGSYDTLLETYGFIFGQWLPESGEKLRDFPSFEKYLNDPHSTPPEQLLTEIHVPLQ
ncbi:MAG: AraC family transcriptional regulator [Kiritimatiellae bacterium]|nr:AraC family transcriptional regulator [Kiritimatiellia bacterium]